MHHHPEQLKSTFNLQDRIMKKNNKFYYILAVLITILITKPALADTSGDWTTSQGEYFTVSDAGLVSGLDLIIDTTTEDFFNGGTISPCGVTNFVAPFADFQLNENGAYPTQTSFINYVEPSITGTVWLNAGAFNEKSVQFNLSWNISIQSPGCSYQVLAGSTINATRNPNPTDTFTLTVQKAGNGQGEVDGGGTYLYNTEVTPTAIPAEGSTLIEWQPAKCSNSFLLNENTVCTATFALKKYAIDISVSPGSGGQVSCTPNPIDHGTSSTCIASPNEGFSFSSWGGDCSGHSGPSCELENVSSDQSIEANFIYTGEEHQLIDAAVLPYARAVAINETATAFASVINNGLRDAINCKIQLPDSISALFGYQTTDINNNLIGTPDTPVDIPVGATQGFVFGITPTNAMSSREIPLIFDCDNAYPAPSHPGLNTFILTATDSIPPDMLAIGATPSNDGVVRLESTNGIGFFATAAVNIGAAGTMTATADDGDKNLPVLLELCETDSAGNWIICGNDLARSVPAGQTVYYSVFVTGTGQPIGFDPANNRLFLRFSANGQTVGATNVAVTTD